MSRIIFITGATSGIGKACAETFAQNGDHLVITGRRKERLEELKAELEDKYATKIYCLNFDVSNKAATNAAIESLPDQWKKVNVLINNAGLALGRDLFDEAEITDWETMIDTNIKGILYVSKALLPGMIEAANAHIINIGSIAGDVMYEGGNVYSATKAAVDALSRSMRIDLLRHHIKVTNIKPGAAETEFGLVRFKGDREKASKTYEGYRPLIAEDISPTVFYCASLPPHVCINDMTLTCTSQANSLYSYKK